MKVYLFIYFDEKWMDMIGSLDLWQIWNLYLSQLLVFKKHFLVPCTLMLHDVSRFQELRQLVYIKCISSLKVQWIWTSESFSGCWMKSHRSSSTEESCKACNLNKISQATKYNIKKVSCKCNINTLHIQKFAKKSCPLSPDPYLTHYETCTIHPYWHL